MIRTLLAAYGIVPIPCELQCLDVQTIQLLSGNPTKAKEPVALRLRSGELVLLIPDTDSLAWLFADIDSVTWILGPGDSSGVYLGNVESRIQESRGRRL